QQEIEPLHRVGANRELMALADVVAVLVDRHRGDAVLRRDLLVVGDARDAVAELTIPLNDFLVGLLTVCQANPGMAVCVQIGALPGHAQARVRIPEAGAGEAYGFGESIDGAPDIRPDRDEDQPNAYAFEEAR